MVTTEYSREEYLVLRAYTVLPEIDRLSHKGQAMGAAWMEPYPSFGIALLRVFHTRALGLGLGLEPYCTPVLRHTSLGLTSCTDSGSSRYSVPLLRT